MPRAQFVALGAELAEADATVRTEWAEALA
jgi:hypothetical protein